MCCLQAIHLLYYHVLDEQPHIIESDMWYFQVVTKLVQIQGKCLSEGDIKNAIYLFMELGRDPRPISRLTHIVYQTELRIKRYI